MKHSIGLLRNLGVSCHTLWQHTPRQLLLQNSTYRSTRFWLLIKKLIHLLLIFSPINSSKNIPLMFINVGVISKYLPCAIRFRRKVKLRRGCFLGSFAINNMAIFQAQSEIKYPDVMTSASSYCCGNFVPKTQFQRNLN